LRIIVLPFQKVNKVVWCHRLSGEEARQRNKAYRWAQQKTLNQFRNWSDLSEKKFS